MTNWINDDSLNLYRRLAEIGLAHGEPVPVIPGKLKKIVEQASEVSRLRIENEVLERNLAAAINEVHRADKTRERVENTLHRIYQSVGEDGPPKNDYEQGVFDVRFHLCGDIGKVLEDSK